jgi:alpha-tubulin suppressor-like RCC1 family protein
MRTFAARALVLVLAAGCSRYHLLGTENGPAHDAGDGAAAVTVGDAGDAIDADMEALGPLEGADAAGDALAPLDAADADAPSEQVDEEVDEEPDAGAEAGPDAEDRDAGPVDASDGGAVLDPTAIVQLAAGGEHTCALRADGSMWCWGGGSDGMLGDGTTPFSRTAPGPVPDLGNDVLRIGSGLYHTMAITSDHSLWLWGSNNLYQLGDGTTQDRHVPWRSFTLVGTVAAVAAGQQNTCALKTDGTVWCWGKNYYGQVGDGTTMDRTIPVQVKGLGDTVADISYTPDGDMGCARKLDGSLWCWGTPPPHSYMDPVTSPEQVTSLGNSVAQVAVGGVMICVRKMDGTLWCWGFNNSDSIGDGTTVYRPAPVQVTTLGNTVVDVSAGTDHACARKADGTLWCWGWNVEGQLGNGTTMASPLPLQVEALGDQVVEVVCSSERTCARKADGTVWCWGAVATGELVVGPIPMSATPIQISFPF